MNKEVKNVNSLAKVLGEDTKILSSLILAKLNLDLANNENNILVNLYNALKDSVYSNNLLKIDFADSVSQTITYILFISRLEKNEITLDGSSILNSDFPLLKDILSLIFYLKDSAKEVLENIVDTLNNTDIKEIFSNTPDPIMYFYENFLFSYSKETRKAKGVWYTPEPVVSFITRSLNEALKTKFGVTNGFGSNNVTVFDFATGTGTFLLSIISLLKEEGLLSKHNMPSLEGYEYMMTPCTVANIRIRDYLRKENINPNNINLDISLRNTLEKIA